MAPRPCPRRAASEAAPATRGRAGCHRRHQIHSTQPAAIPLGGLGLLCACTGAVITPAALILNRSGT